MDRHRLKFIENLQKKNPNLELVGEYRNKLEDIRVRCSVCGTERVVRALTVLNTPRCFNCEPPKVTSYTHEDFVRMLDDANPGIIVIGEYSNLKTHIKIKCAECNHVWKAIPGNLLNGSGCPNCLKQKHTEKLKASIHKLETEYTLITLLSHGTTSRDLVRVRCNLCGNEWDTNLQHLLARNPKLGARSVRRLQSLESNR